MKRHAKVLLAALVLAACSSEPLLDPTIAARQVGGGAPKLDVMTWNVYVGAGLENLLLVTDPNQIPVEVANIVAQVVATDFPARAEAIADQIERLRPDVISLQEMSEFRTQSPGDVVFGNPTPATTPFMDWRTILDDALAARGLSYEIRAETMNFDIELPIVSNTPLPDDIRLTDYDVILVREGVRWANAAGGNYAAALPIDLGGTTILKPSGWTSVDVEVHGKWYRYVNTHLESADVGGVVDPQLAALQALQLAELSTILDGSPYPVILTGDFNSAAAGTTTDTYEDLLDGGFVDTWLAGKPLGPGFTSNQAEDLLNVESLLFHRIDFVLFRNRVTGTSGHLTGAAKSELVGEESADRTSNGLWPSDHAGVFTALSLAPGNGIR